MAEDVLSSGSSAGDNLLFCYRARKNEARDTVRPLLEGSQLGPSSNVLMQIKYISSHMLAQKLN